ncbi:MAG: patatin-like phospholipase family protein [Candidatus Binatia bacterium]
MRDVLGRVALFGPFNTQELESLATLCTELVLEKGEVVCRAGDPGDRLFVLASGELEVWDVRGDTLLDRLQPGELVGEMSLLLGAPRSATVTVARAARLLAIDRPAFERYFLQNAKVLEHLSRYLARRLATVARGERAARTTTIAVTAASGLRGKSFVAAALTAVLRHLTGDEVLLVRLVPLGRATDPPFVALANVSDEQLRHVIASRSGPLGPEVVVAAAARNGERHLVDELARLETMLASRFATIVFDVDDAPGFSHAAEAVSDIVVEIADRARPGEDAAGRDRFVILDLYNAGTPVIPINHCEPFVLPVDPQLRTLDPAARALWIRDHRTAPVARPLHRLARKLLGTSVGLALGGGAAFGIAHVGVLKVLEDDGIPVDVIAGTSMGAIVGAGYASGITPGEMLDVARRIGNWRTTLFAVIDPTLSRPALLSGEKMARIFGAVAGAADSFEDLVVPYRAVAADAETGERVAIGTGSIAMAYRASAAVPLLWAPIKIDGRIFIDGSMVDPVPGEVVRTMGADVCIAVNVVPPLRRGVQSVLACWYHRLNRVNPLAYVGGSQGMPSMFDLGMNTIQMIQYELGNYRAISADLVINPDLGEFTWIEFYRAAELIEHGAAAAERALPHIRRLLADRLAPRGYGTRRARNTGATSPAFVFGDGAPPDRDEGTPVSSRNPAL